MRQPINNIIRYFRDCYQADNREMSIQNFWGNKVLHPHELPSAELLEGRLVSYPVSTAWGDKVAKHLLVYGKEKELLCGSFFLTGKLGNQLVRAPLFLTPVRLIEHQDVFYLEITSDQHQLNPAFIQAIQSGNEEMEQSYEQLQSRLPLEFIQFKEFIQIEEILRKTAPQIDFSLFKDFPNLVSKTDWPAEESKSLRLIPAIAVGVARKSIVTREILNELNDLTTRSFFSEPLQLLLGSKLNKKGRGQSSPIYVPANLSKPQEKIIKTVEKQVLSMVIGPPGTGKSFTIASIAIDALSKGQSVLIVAKTDQAVDVIQKKIKVDFGFEQVAVRGGKREYLKLIQERLENILYGIGVEWVPNKELRKLRGLKVSLSQQIEAKERQIRGQERLELAAKPFLKKKLRNWWKRLRQYWRLSRIKDGIPIWKTVSELEELIDQRVSIIQEYVGKSFDRRLYNALRSSRSNFQLLFDALKARTGNQKDDFFEVLPFEELTQALPIWLVRTGALGSILPFRRDLFDLVIIDEATQCDIASALPALQRAKKAVIVGDPKQLRHISFLSKVRMHQLIAKYNLQKLDFQGLNFRKNSILDLTSMRLQGQDQLAFLNEHYRSVPSIIQFSNAQFYGDKLKIMTQLRGDAPEDHLKLLPVDGKRLKSGVNRQEAKHVIEDIQQIIESEKNVQTPYCQSIGVLSPFREQVNYLQKQLNKTIDTTNIARHQILVGTPYEFQGEERDIMLLSFAIDNNVHPSVLQYLNKPDIFNVSVTRARVEQRVYTSFAWAELGNQYLLKQYLDFIRTLPAESSYTIKKIPARVSFLKEIIEVIKGFGVAEVFPAYQIAGLTLDLFFPFGEETYCIDLVGFPGDFEDAFAIEHYKTLFRLGIEVLVLPYSLWTLEKERCVAYLEGAIVG